MIRLLVSVFGQEFGLTAVRFTIFNVIFPLHLTLCFIANALSQVSFLSHLSRQSSKMSVPDQRPHTPVCATAVQNPEYSKSSFILFFIGRLSVINGVYSSMIHWEKKHKSILLTIWI